MKKYNIKVNGNMYEVEVEEVDSESVEPKKEVKAQSKKKELAKAERKKPEAPKAKSQPKSVPSGAETVNAPMPGSVLELNVSEGDSVSEGEVLLILEAMKMENEIVAPRDSKVSAINVSKGQSVNSGDPLISLE